MELRVSKNELIAKLGEYKQIEEIEKAFPSLQVYWDEKRAHLYDDTNRIALTAALSNGCASQWEEFGWYEAWSDFMQS